MFSFLLWYLTLSLLGLLTFPLTRRLLPALADQGYSLSRTLGLLLWGFIFWLSTSFGLTQNDMPGLLFSLLVLAGLSAWAFWASREEEPNEHGALAAFFRTNWRTVLTTELLFLAAFAFLAFVRANNPENVGTEKPMEMAFINAILHSPTFPPHDPWLSGYAISYYYFGYVMAAMLAKFTATSGGVAFNLMISLVFALSAVGAYGLLYNLLGAYRRAREPETAETPSFLAPLAALLGPLFLLILSNVEGFLEFLHNLGVGWSGQIGDTNLWTSLGGLVRPNLQAYNFWTWLDIKDLSAVPTLGADPRFWFWWRASRVVQDYDLRGNFVEVIDEFPFFSYLLGDLHPHVLAMPFGLLAAALALNLYLGGWKGEVNLKWFKLPIRAEGLGLLAAALGGLAFLNTWDFPVYLAVVCGGFVLAQAQERGWRWSLLEDFFKLAVPLGLFSILLYLPFYVSFSSQAGGILPNVIFPTRGVQLWVMFGTLFALLFPFLWYVNASLPADWKTGGLLTLAFLLALGLFSLILTFVAAQTDTGQSFIASQGFSSTGAVLQEAFARRLAFGGSLLTLAALIGLALASITAAPVQAQTNLAGERNPIPFVVMLILFGGLLVLAPEFVYLRDQFGTRMNTVFKFYYQAWALWSAAAAFGVLVMLCELRGARRVMLAASLLAVVTIGMVYPVLSLPNKTNHFDAQSPGQRTLDGAAYLESYSPDDYAAIQFMSTLPSGVVVEAVGGSYSEFARAATYSGQPAVLGWPGHEGQWRGGYTEQGTRSNDIQTLYETSDWDTALSIIQKYDIRYLYIGTLEARTYHVNEEKFHQHLPVIYQQGQVVIYQVP